MSSDTESWIQADLRQRFFLISVTTQGRSDANYWITSYLFSYSRDDVTWTNISILYSANSDRNTKVTNQLPGTADGRFIRLHPQTWEGSVGLRWEVNGITSRSFSGVAYLDLRSASLIIDVR